MFLRCVNWGLMGLLAAVSVGAEERPAAPAPAESVKLDYVLQPSDLLRVQIFQEDDLNRDVRISQQFTISLPLIGTINLKDKNVRQTQEIIRALYDRDYLVNPQVNVTVLEYAKRSVNVLGSVNTPGVVLFPQEEGLTLLDAIARVGGFNRLADRKHVRLTRTTPDGKTANYVINTDDIIQGGTTETWALVPNDVIYVPERLL